MSRPKGKPRVTKPTKSKKKPKPDAPKVELKSRTGEQKAVDYNETQPAVDTPTESAAPQDEEIEFAFEYDGETYRFNNPDEDLIAALEAATILSNGGIALHRKTMGTIMPPDEWRRFQAHMQTDVNRVLQLRTEWKKNGKPPEQEPISVADFTAHAFKQIFEIWREIATNNPKGTGR